MEKLVRVPFDIELAKRIQNGEIEGKIVDTFYECPVRIVDFNFKTQAGKLNIGISQTEDKEVLCPCNDEGVLFFIREGKFDKGPLLALDIPEYLTFKDGDVVVTDDRIVIIRNPKMDNLNGFCFSLYVAYDCKGKTLFYCADFINQEKVRFATEEEKQILIKRLKASKQPKDKERLKRFFGIDAKQECEFKPFDRVLVRQSESDKWEAMLFSNYTSEIHRYRCGGMNYMHCIPYEGNKDLIDTDKPPCK